MPKATTIKTTAAKASSSNVTKGKTTLVQSTLAGFSKTTVKATVAVADENAEEKELVTVEDETTEEMQLALESLKAQRSAVTEAILGSLEETTMGKSWHQALETEFSKPYFTELKRFLLSEFKTKTVFPTIDNIYSWSRYTPLPNVKVIILGQDPYHDVNQAHGLSFSVLEPTKPPPSLRNIYKQLASDFPAFKPPKMGDLSPIARQGVLWLNASLTVQAHKAASHSKKGWETFTGEVIRTVLSRKDTPTTGVVVMAWGLPAQSTISKIGLDQTKHLLLKSAHPSPLSASRGFIGNEHFKKANEWLVSKYGKSAAIDWMALSAK